MSDGEVDLERAVEEFLARRRREPALDARTFAADFPGLGPELLELLEAAEFLEGARGVEPAVPHFEVPKRVGAFRVESELGAGGMGIVLAAIEEPLERRVALKLLPPHLVQSVSARARFQREAVLASRLEHSGICAVFGAGVADGRPWIAMRLVEGPTLAALIRAARERGETSLANFGASEPERMRGVSTCVARVARALAFAHGKGVLHRDVKPSNIAITADGEPVLLDFGLAIEPDSQAPSLTLTGETAGTPAYLAPELLSGARTRPDARCDVYALGVTLFEALVLVPPFRAPTRETLFREILDGAPDIRRTRPDVPRDLAVIVATAIEREPARRYASAENFAADLEAFVAGRPISARPVGALGRVLRWARREPRQASLAAGLAVFLLAFAVAGGVLIASRDDVQAGRDAQLARQVDDELQRAFADVGAGRAALADERFVRVLELDSVNAEAVVGRIFALLRLKRTDEALALLRDAPRTPVYEHLRALAANEPLPADDSSWLSRANSFELFVEGELLRIEAERRPPSERKEGMRRALERFDEAVIRSPQPRAIYHQLRAVAASKAGDERATRSACAALESLWPDSSRVLYQAGAALVEFDPRRALALLERSIQLDDRYAPAFQCAGIVHMRLADLERAVEAFTRAVEIDRGNVEAWNGLGSAQLAMGCDDDARAAWLECLSVQPTMIQAWGNLTMLAMRMGNSRDVADCAARVLELDPGQTPYRAVYAEALGFLNELERSRDEYAIVVAEAPQRAELWLYYGQVLLALGELDLALGAAGQARALNPALEGLDPLEAQARAALESGH